MDKSQRHKDRAYGIYFQGLFFLGTFRLIHREMTKDQGYPGFMCPLAVNGSFAAELLLKCLHAMDSGSKAPEGHNLLKLFDSLQAGTKAEIQATYDVFVAKEGVSIDVGRLPKIPRDLRGRLEMSKDAFVLFRYIYEDRMKDGDGWALQTALDSLQCVVEARHPEWRD